jgi:lysyl-tRNA synthetase class I
MAEPGYKANYYNQNNELHEKAHKRYYETRTVSYCPACKACVFDFSLKSHILSMMHEKNMEKLSVKDNDEWKKAKLFEVLCGIM